MCTPFYRHVIFAPSAFDAYSGASFPGISDILYGLDEDAPFPEKKATEIQQHLALLTYMIERAAAILKDNVLFME